MEDQEKLEQVIEIIEDSRFDVEEMNHLITYLHDSIKAQREAQARRTKATLKVGDSVQLSGLKPARLNGLVVTVTEIRRNRIVADVPDRGTVTIPLSCVTRV